jgi:sulfur-carrier protein
MKAQVRLFAIARQLAGRDVVTVDVPDGATIADLRTALHAACPQLGDALRHMLFAVAADYAADTTPLPPAADIACIPPVSGG